MDAEASIRLYREEDLEVLREITVLAFERVSIDRNIETEFGPIAQGDWRKRKAQHINDDVQREPNGVFVATLPNGDSETVIGYITTWCDRDAGIGHIPNLAVLEAHRGHGLGRRLIATAIDYFRSQGMKLARIETLEQNPVGQSLYPSMGFQEVARQIHYCQDLTDK